LFRISIVVVVVVQERNQADGVCKKGVIKQGVWVSGVESKGILQKITGSGASLCVLVMKH
jgi:hypothetical protein